MLPKLSLPEYTVMVPSTKEEVKFHPFLVGGEKLLLMAQASNDSKEIVSTIKQIIKNCVPVFENRNLDEFPAFDLEYLFLKIRAKSVNNVIDLTYRDNEDQKTYDFKVNLDEIDITYTENHTNKIQINDKVAMFMKYPSASMTENLGNAENELDIYFALIRNCIDNIVDEKEIYDFKNYTKEELDEFIQSLPVSSLTQIQEFFDTAPKMEHKLLYVNSLGNNREIVLKTLTDFFFF